MDESYIPPLQGVGLVRQPTIKTVQKNSASRNEKNAGLACDEWMTCDDCIAGDEWVKCDGGMAGDG